MAKIKKVENKNTNKFYRVKLYVKIILVLIWLLMLPYLLRPSLEFPSPPSDAFQSQEPADIETNFRRAYFTNFSREEVIAHYENQFQHGPFSFLRQRLNYPPEDAQVLVRDQTRSTFLEELSYPFRESLYINGFQPKDAKDDIWYKGVHYNQKITIKYVPNDVLPRIAVAIGTLVVSVLLVHELLRRT